MERTPSKSDIATYLERDLALDNHIACVDFVDALAHQLMGVLCYQALTAELARDTIESQRDLWWANGTSAMDHSDRWDLLQPVEQVELARYVLRYLESIPNTVRSYESQITGTKRIVRKYCALEQGRFRYQFAAKGLPDHMEESITGYVFEGRPVGNFLQALLKNNLQMTFAYADEQNRKRIHQWVQFIYNDVPADCWGDDERIKNWIEIGGYDPLNQVKS